MNDYSFIIFFFESNHLEDQRNFINHGNGYHHEQAPLFLGRREFIEKK